MIAAANPEHLDLTSFLDSLSYQAAGLAVVLLSLGFLAIAVAVIGRFLTPRPKKAKSQPRPEPVDESLTPEVVAVIAAAVAHTLKKPHRIVQIHSSTSPWLQAWSLEGRRQIFQSHHLR